MPLKGDLIADLVLSKAAAGRFLGLEWPCALMSQWRGGLAAASSSPAPAVRAAD